MSGRALVTGATGMLGSYIVARLLADGWHVRALVRGATNGQGAAAWLESLGVEVVRGSLEERGALLEGASACDVVFHAAAVIDPGGSWRRFREGNVVGTANVVSAAQATGARLVHVSSTAVYGRARYASAPTDETAPLPTLPEHDVYGRSKQEAERLVLRAHATGRVWATVVRPPVMYGRRDRQFAPRIGPVLSLGVFPLIAGGRTTLTLVHAGSVAEGAVRAACRDVAGGRVYLLANDYPVTTEDLVRCAAEGLERRIWAPVVPARAGRVGFAALERALRLTGKVDLARHAAGTLEMLTRDNPFCSARARRELGWAPPGCADTLLADALRWWATHANGVRA